MLKINKHLLVHLVTSFDVSFENWALRAIKKFKLSLNIKYLQI